MSKCNDANANALMHQLFQIPTHNREAQVAMVNALPSGVVPYVLTRGFGVTIPSSGKRALLMRLVAHTGTIFSREDRIAVAAEIEEERQARVRLQAQAAQVHQPFDIIVALDVCIQAFQTFEYFPGMVTVLPGHLLFNDIHTDMNPKTALFGIVIKLLKTMYDLESMGNAVLPAFIRQEVINTWMQNKLNNFNFITAALNDCARNCNIYIAPAGFVHMINMARMYNYIRMLQADQTRFNFTLNHAGFVHVVAAAPVVVLPPPQPIQMKALKIRLIVMIGLNEEDTDDEEENALDDDHHKCGVCFDNFTERKLVITGCNHAFCSGCIHGVARNRGLKSFIQCPSCRAEILELSVSQHDHAAVVAGIAPGLVVV